MKTLEFTTKIKNGIIKIPERYSNLKDIDVNVILQMEDDKRNSNQTINIISALQEIRKKKIFNKIDDPLNWQREIRNEW